MSLKVLNVGCGNWKLSNVVNLDIERKYDPDVLADFTDWENEEMFAIEDYIKGNSFGYFDAVIFSHSLEHIDSPYEALYNCHVYLMDRGKVVIVVPNLWFYRRILHYALKKNINEDMLKTRHYQGFDYLELSRLLFHLNFKVIHITFFDRFDETPKNFIDKIMRKLLPKYLGRKSMLVIGEKI